MSDNNTIIIGIGNRNRGDDALGCLVVEKLNALGTIEHEIIEHNGEPASLMDRWLDYSRAIIIDAVSSHGEAGTVFNFDLKAEQLPKEFRRTSTHGFGLFEAIELGRVFDTLPDQMSFHGIEGSNFQMGDKVSEELNNAIDKIIENVLGEI